MDKAKEDFLSTINEENLEEGRKNAFITYASASSIDGGLIKIGYDGFGKVSVINFGVLIPFQNTVEAINYFKSKVK